MTPGSPVWRTPVAPLPFHIGRRGGEHLRLDSGLVSGQHAELFELDGNLRVRDLGSTNGTFLNGVRVEGEESAVDGDVLVFGDQEFRVVGFDAAQGFRTTRVISSLDGGGSWLTHGREVEQQVREGQVEIHLQPIVGLGDGELYGYEVLGRGSLGGVAVGPQEMFMAAAFSGVIPELCRAYRRQGLVDGVGLSDDLSLLLNTHPLELEAPVELIAGLEELRREFPDRPMILEIHEAAASDVEELRRVADVLEKLDIGLAYDDFGTGRDRLAALAETSPRLLKFDVALIRGLDTVTPRRRDMVRRLVEMVRELEIAPLAECIETESERLACLDSGFQFGQGFLLGRPTPVGDLGEESGR
ncbi:MAG: EAL domain-containing protein [Thermoanaerobaculia bacterium]|nr:EAL domain-containing protein [Thermoanaerobaculia bacterium]